VKDRGTAVIPSEPAGPQACHAGIFQASTSGKGFATPEGNLTFGESQFYASEGINHAADRLE
jgi:hypothetical protein